MLVNYTSELCFTDELFYNAHLSADVPLVDGFKQYACYWVPSPAQNLRVYNEKGMYRREQIPGMHAL